MKLTNILFMLHAVLPFAGFAQTGPGGVGNAANNAFWVRPDQGTSTTTDGAPVTAWNDGSGNALNINQTTAPQQPIFRANVMNGYPSIQFDNNSTPGQNDFLLGPNSPLLDNTDGLTIFSVSRPTTLDGEARSIVSKRTGVDVNQSYMFFYYTSNHMFGDIVGIDNRFSTNPTTFSVNNNYLASFSYNGTLPMASRSRIYSGNTLLVTAAENAASIPSYSSPLTIGATHSTDPRPFGGYISEVIIFREALNDTRRLIINNYLSAKYNIPLASGDIYTMDDPGNGNFDHEVAGIGRISATDLHNDAQGSSIVRISNPSGLDNNEFLLWGHNNASLQASNTSDVPAGVQARFARVWRASEVNASNAAVDVGAITIRWDLRNLGSVVPANLCLLIDTDNDGIFSDETPILGAVSAGGTIYQFSGVTAITNQSRFTLGTTNKATTPLPITMVSFTAGLLNERSVELNWETASEADNDYFTAERSEDLSNWTTVSTVKGAGNSSTSQFYKVNDSEPAQGINYYRIRQTDFNGQFTYSDIRSVLIEQQEEILLFPNPANEFVIINRGNGALIQVQNAIGQMIQTEQIVTGNSTQLDISQIPAGNYFILVTENEVMTCKKLTVN